MFSRRGGCSNTAAAIIAPDGIAAALVHRLPLYLLLLLLLPAAAAAAAAAAASAVADGAADAAVYTDILCRCHGNGRQ